MTINAIALSDVFDHHLVHRHSPALIAAVETSLALSVLCFRRVCPSYRPSHRVGHRVTCHMKSTLPINNPLPQALRSQLKSRQSLPSVALNISARAQQA
ncbi:hypothetical protein CLIM01_14862 [Colletotrichum limetticola]|uniref:Uncharacterized protein n=1 Tax=Colletotrichum limetticola TaxID=1209924 RepID=A0ABQ9P822_9PEZI|nr:hypothetical protein CLIM01_14862 [Colletotrichum limetticola]